MNDESSQSDRRMAESRRNIVKLRKKQEGEYLWGKL